MEYFIGLDVSMKETFICIVDEKGRVAYENIAVTDPDDIASQILQTGLTVVKAGVESGCLSNWLVTQLQSRGIPAICIDARRLSGLLASKPNKTDKNDARVIAEAIRGNFYQEVHLKNNRQVDISMLLSARKALVNQRTTLKNTIRGLLKACGVKELPAGKKAFLNAVKECIGSHQEEVKVAINSILVAFEVVSQEIERMDKKLEEIAENDDDAKLLMTVPGVGVITALSYLCAIGDVTRFKKSRCVGAYLGMAPKQYSSGQVEKRKGISKYGSSMTRSLLVEAGIVILSRVKSSSKLKSWGQRIMKKKGRKKAAVAVGRKLAVIMHRMLVTREIFRTEVIKEVKQKKQVAVAA